MRGIRARLESITGGASPTPLLVLFGLNFVDEFDRWAFAALVPEIRDAFSLGDTGIGAITVLVGVFVVLAGLPLGYLADRVNRVRLGTVAAVLWGAMSVLTGLVPTVALLVGVRFVAGIGRVTNEVVHPSLLTDYYDHDSLPRVFALHRLANPISGVAGVIAGGIAAWLSWEWAFFLLAIPTFLLIGGIAGLREPARGESLDPDLAATVDADEDPVPFGESRRRLFAVGSLRRIWLASVLNGVAVISVPALLSLFYENVYAFGPVGRGTVQFLFAGGTVGGLFAGLWLADRVSGRGDPPGLAKVVGGAGLLAGGGLLVMVLSPWPAISLLALVVLGVGAGAYQPAYFPLVGRVSPPRLRSQAYGWAVMFIAVGGLLSLPLFEVGDVSGYRPALGIVAGMIAASGAIAWSAHGFVQRDVDEAESALEAAADLRRRVEETGEGVLLAAQGVEVSYGQVQVLFGADLEIQESEIVALLGTNGAGKSTLLKAISGLVDPRGGSIVFDGRDITHAGARQTAGLGIAQMPGGRAVFPDLTVDEHLRISAWLEDDPDVARASIDRALDLFPALADRRRQRAGALSGGEQQMLGLAMALIARPRLLMIDELSLGLAPAIVEALLEVVREIRDRGTAVLVVEQSVNVALELADRAYFMEKGETRFRGPTSQLLERDDLLRSVFLAGATGSGDGTGEVSGDVSGDVSGEVSGDVTGEVSGDDVPGAATVDDTVETPTADGAATAPGVLAARGLSRRFGGIVAVDDVDLTLQDGEILGVIGPNGAGKTTLFDLLTGYLRPDAGRVHLGGEDVTALAPHHRARLGLGRSFQDARLVPSLTTAENLALGLERHLPHHDHLAAALALPGMIEQEEDVAYTVADLVELMGLGAYRDKFVRELSTGTRRVVDLAMVIAHDPEVLLLDEPSSGIAQREAEALEPLLRRIQRETGCALIVIEHDMPLITGLADRLVALDLGRVMASGRPSEVVADPHVVESYLGGDLAAVRRSGEVAR